MKKVVPLLFLFGIFFLLFVSKSKLEVHIDIFLNDAPAENSYLLLNTKNNLTMRITTNMDAKCLIKILPFPESLIVKPNNTLLIIKKGSGQVTFWLIPTSVPQDNYVSINYHVECNSTSILQKSFFSANGWVIMNVTDKT